MSNYISRPGIWIMLFLLAVRALRWKALIGQLYCRGLPIAQRHGPICESKTVSQHQLRRDSAIRHEKQNGYLRQSSWASHQ
jgi:hypothetical protein